MTLQRVQKLISFLLIGGAIFLGVRYLLPISVPFLLGGLIALSAEPGVRLLEKKLSWRRAPASGLCVSLTLLLLLTVVSVIGAVAVRELGTVARFAPQLAQTIGSGLAVLEDTMLTVAGKAPDNLRPMLTRAVTNTFQDGTTLLNGMTEKLPGMVAGVMGWLSQGVLTAATTVLAGFMISARLPRIRAWIRRQLPQAWKDSVLPALKQTKHTFGKWIGAQCKLMLITFAVVGLGLTFLGIPYGILWGGLIALVDAVPILGTGTVMVPWAVISFLQGNSARGIGLLLVFGSAWLTRNLLEPRLIGKSLGLDPLLALVSFYGGLKLWGLPGMLLLPIAAALAKSLLQKGFSGNSQIFHKETS